MTSALDRLAPRARQRLGPLEAQHGDDFIVDGEIVAFEGSRTSFERLQRRIQLHDPADLGLRHDKRPREVVLERRHSR